tara:strand:+ start:254 stop:1054 length:801 start_codon:yes stop_codon:yes gene_type:complete
VPSAQNWLLLLTFDGASYHGWQFQPDIPTIQDALQKAILRLTGEAVIVHGAGRTDSGVHALNYTANFNSTSNNIKTSEKWCSGLNAVLPDDIVVKSVQNVSGDFHARHNAIGKRYRYLISNNSYHSPFTINKSWHVGQILDLDKMNQVAEVLKGEHDFSAFRSSNCSSPNTVKDIREISIVKSLFQNSILQIEIEANSFLQHMVRIITGTLVEVAQARMSCADVKKALYKGDRNLAGPTAPAHGLYSLKVIYPDGLVQWPQKVIEN